MKVSELIEKLKQYPPDLVVKMYDHDRTTHDDPDINLVNTITDPSTWNEIKGEFVEISLAYNYT